MLTRSLTHSQAVENLQKTISFCFGFIISLVNQFYYNEGRKDRRSKKPHREKSKSINLTTTKNANFTKTFTKLLMRRRSCIRKQDRQQKQDEPVFTTYREEPAYEWQFMTSDDITRGVQETGTTQQQ